MTHRTRIEIPTLLYDRDGYQVITQTNVGWAGYTAWTLLRKERTGRPDIAAQGWSKSYDQARTDAHDAYRAHRARWWTVEHRGTYEDEIYDAIGRSARANPEDIRTPLPGTRLRARDLTPDHIGHTIRIITQHTLVQGTLTRIHHSVPVDVTLTLDNATTVSIPRDAEVAIW